ncbi:MAG: hypothetical protein K2Y28_07150 [Burkholderiaceae bacterium]|nr:hypothetical protein [Burkholderiaceae bacterium]
MDQMQWCTRSASELAQFLTHATVQQSAAIGDNTLYHVKHEGNEKLALSLSDGSALVIELRAKPSVKRRRIDEVAATADIAGHSDISLNESHTKR